MIPLYSDRKITTFPFVTILLITANVWFFWHQFTMPGSVDKSVMLYGAIPFDIVHPGALNIPGRLPAWLTLFTAVFSHGGFIHIISNMLFLWVFGRDIEDDLGHFEFLIFYLITGVISTSAFVYAFPESKIPLVGASGAIAGVLGIYFLRFPFARIQTMFIIIILIKFLPVPAFFFLGIWFAIQFYSCAANATAGAAGQGGVAWLSHIAGFVTGIVWTLFLLRRRYYARGRR